MAMASFTQNLSPHWLCHSHFPLPAPRSYTTGLPHCEEQGTKFRNSEGPRPAPALLGMLGGLSGGRPGTLPALSLLSSAPQTPLCNGSMVWSVNLTTSMQYCAALESLINISDCSAIQKTQRMLSALCSHKPPSEQVPGKHIRDTKIEVAQFVKDLLKHLRMIFRHG
uniref:Interleukin-13 n=1 Tax=Sus scrofa TaxID=9823 RepID=A0A8D0UW48_PIG